MDIPELSFEPALSKPAGPRVVVAIQGLTFGYDKQPIFKDFDFATDARCTLVRGPSGCGKTTLLKLIDGLVRGNRSVSIQRPEPVFLVLQADGLAPWLTGRENIELFSKEHWVRVRESPLFPLVEAFADRRAHALSFGQRRSIELVRALVSGYPLLLFDEPLNFLDHTRRAAILTHMRDPGLCQSSIIMTSHYEEEDMIGSADAFEFVGDPPYRSLARKVRI